MSLDREKLAKVLALMSSPLDGEALAAARQAAVMVSGAGLRWSDVVDPPPPVVAVSGRRVTVTVYDGEAFPPPRMSADKK